MKFSTYELLGFAASIMLLAATLWLLQYDASKLTLATVPADQNTAAVVVSSVDQGAAAVAGAVRAAASPSGELERLIVDDVVLGTGERVDVGDTVTVHYIGRLQSGQEFDNSRKRGEPFRFTVGDERVISGWEQGVVGMQVGGQRILVIPPQLAYGDKQFGPIPANSTLVFAIELLSIE